MFTWICPKCGREVPPSYSECPTCAEAAQKAAAPPPPPPQPQPPQQQAYPPPPYPGQAYPPQQYPPQYQPQYPPQGYPPPQYPPQGYAPAPLPQSYPPPPAPSYLPPEPAPGMAPWMKVVGTFAVLGLVLGALYYFVGGTETSGATPAAKSAPAAASPAQGGDHPYAKFLEVTGLRITEDGAKKAKVTLLVINHEGAEVSGLELTVRLGSSAAKAGDAPLLEFPVKVGSLGAHESKEISVSVTSNVRAYELPDWQFLRATFEITSPR